MGTSRRRTPPAPVSAGPPKGARTACRGTQEIRKRRSNFKRGSRGLVAKTACSVSGLEEDPELAVTAIVAEAEKAVREDRAEVICLGCGGMAGLDERIKSQCGVPVIDGVSAAVTLAESLVTMGLSTSKIRTYAAPRPKRIIGWPISTAAALQ